MQLKLRIYPPAALDSIDADSGLVLLPSRYPPVAYPALVRLRADRLGGGEPIELIGDVDFYGPDDDLPALDMPLRIRLRVIDGEAVDGLIETFIPVSHAEIIAVWQPDAALGSTLTEWVEAQTAPATAAGITFDWRREIED